MVDIVPQLEDWLRFSHTLPKHSSHSPHPHSRNLQLVQSYSVMWLLVDASLLLTNICVVAQYNKYLPAPQDGFKCSLG